MHLLTLQRRSLRHYWRSHLAVVLGVLVGSAALTGALLVGDSMRGSLRAAALDRLGRVSFVLHAPSGCRAALADDVAASDVIGRACPVMLERASATHADTRANVQRVQVLGVERGFWGFAATSTTGGQELAGRGLVLNQTLADELRAAVGDDVLLRLGRNTAISPETLLGRRDDATVTLRLTVDRIIPASGLGAFALNPRQAPPRNAYVPLKTLQRALKQPGRANTLLIETAAVSDDVEKCVRQRATLADYGLRLRVSEPHGYVSLESTAFLLSPPIETAARAAGDTLHYRTVGLLAYLANDIATEPPGDDSIPYSTVVALAPTADIGIGELQAGEIVLNDWAARRLGVGPGAALTLSYYVTAPGGRLDTRQATFRVRGVVELTGAAADPGFTPDYPGITDADRLGDWDPPFPIDLDRITPADEEYWDSFRATPKAFVTLADGQRLWAEQDERFGQLTALRVYPPAGVTLAAAAREFERELLARFDPTQAGFKLDAVRDRALDAGQGTTDFAGLFIGFSLFLIASAALLVALLFRLGVERRAREIGLLLAIGFRPARITRLLLTEGLLIAIVGAAAGLPAARGYAGLMLSGLRSWWSDAVNTPFLRLHAEPASYVFGLIGSILVVGVAIIWSLRGVTRTPAGLLLAGSVPAGRVRARQARRAAITAGLGLGLAAVTVAVSLATDHIPPVVAFFLGGVALLVAGLAGLAVWLRTTPHAAAITSGPLALVRIGVRNARRHPGRSLLTASLIASATFSITALQAVRLTTAGDVHARDSGTGGFTLLAEMDVPLLADPNTLAGRDALGLGDDVLADTTLVPFRLRPGDETSCLNLYRPTEPRLLGASPSMVERGGFAFASTLANSAAQRANPWTLLGEPLPDHAIPAIADQAAAQWQLHTGLGEELTVTGERGRTVRLRLVALLKGSVLQGEIIIAESHFTRLFPSIAGHAFFLIDTPIGQAAAVEQTLERELTDYGLAATPTQWRLAELNAVQNTYLSTFQTLGGLGLLLGTVGLAVVMLRNVWERRGELALLRALGFSRRALGVVILAENAALVGAGLLTGLVSAAIVIAPHVVDRAVAVPWAALLLMFAAIFAAGLLAGALALISTLRAPILPSLRAQ